MYELVFTRHFEKDFRVLPGEMQKRLLLRLKDLQADPFKDARKLKGVLRGRFRVRVGEYRVRYDLDEKTILLYYVKHRKEICRNI